MLQQFPTIRPFFCLVGGFPCYLSRFVNQVWAALKPRMLQHFRRRGTVWWAILRHGDDQISKTAQARLREPQISRSKAIIGSLQDISDTAYPIWWCCHMSVTKGSRRIITKYNLGSAHRDLCIDVYLVEYGASIPEADLQRRPSTRQQGHLYAHTIDPSKEPFQRRFRISFRDVNWASKFDIRRVLYQTAQTPNIPTWAKVRIEDNLWRFITERNSFSVVNTVPILFPKIYYLHRRRIAGFIFGSGRRYLITRRSRRQWPFESLNLTDSIVFYCRALITP